MKSVEHMVLHADGITWQVAGCMISHDNFW
jgi:hypothetical protein